MIVYDYPDDEMKQQVEVLWKQVQSIATICLDSLESGAGVIPHFSAALMLDDKLGLMLQGFGLLLTREEVIAAKDQFDFWWDALQASDSLVRLTVRGEI